MHVLRHHPWAGRTHDPKCQLPQVERVCATVTRDESVTCERHVRALVEHTCSIHQVMTYLKVMYRAVPYMEPSRLAQVCEDIMTPRDASAALIGVERTGAAGPLEITPRRK